MANGFRNRFTEAIASNNIKLARQYISTTYCLITLIVIAAIGLLIGISNYVNFSSLLHLDINYNEELTKVFGLLCICLGLTMITGVFTKFLLALQLPAVAGLMVFVGQLFTLTSILLLKKYTHSSLVMLALWYSTMPILSVIIFSLIFYCFTKYRIYRPSIRYVNFSLFSKICGIGLKFFIIQICLICIFQLINIIISRNLGMESVTEYNITYKYTNLLMIVTTLCVTPLWSAFTDAYSKEDYSWMNNIIRKLDKYNLILVAVAIVMILSAHPVFEIWIGNKITISNKSIIAIMIFSLAQTSGFIYMNICNGLGKVNIQLIIFSIFAFIAYPAMNFFCAKFGIIGICIIPSTVYLSQTVFLRLQIHKILNKSALGIWNS